MSTERTIPWLSEFEPSDADEVGGDLSGEWKAVFGHLDAETSIEPEESSRDSLRVLAATRSDRPERYRRKHRNGVTS
ncbi:hypothetical protein [Natronorarus salvus]|uniref:hypothetical protein n=1 Tax=Natronorarus salvus TaxID=3117733 RepID=UPI002F26BD00